VKLRAKCVRTSLSNLTAELDICYEHAYVELCVAELRELREVREQVEIATDEKTEDCQAVR
jgi:hypothetical protein